MKKDYLEKPNEKVKIKISTRENGSRRVVHETTGESRTDQSYKDSCCVNKMMKQYAKTGLLPNLNHKEPFYGDVSEVPSFQEAFEITQAANEMFYELPAEVRKQMGNDIRNLEAFILDPDNHGILIEHGMMAEKKAQKQEVKEPKKDDKVSENKKESKES